MSNTTRLATVMISVASGAPLPRIGDTLFCRSDLSGLTYAVRVTALTALRWLPDGDLEVTVRGAKHVVDPQDGQEGGEG